MSCCNLQLRVIVLAQINLSSTATISKEVDMLCVYRKWQRITLRN